MLESIAKDLRTEVNRLVGEINGQLGTPERTLWSILTAPADVCWVGALRDGMNLLAREYAACKAEGDGVLVLSVNLRAPPPKWAKRF